MKHKSFFAIQESQPKEVPINEIEQRSDVAWTPRPKILRPQHPLVRIAEYGWLNQRPRHVPAFEFLLRQKMGIVIVFFNPERDAVLLLIVFDEIVLQIERPAADIEMVVNKIA